jgi:hypothetical protein
MILPNRPDSQLTYGLLKEAKVGIRIPEQGQLWTC